MMCAAQQGFWTRTCTICKINATSHLLPTKISVSFPIYRKGIGQGTIVQTSSTLCTWLMTVERRTTVITLLGLYHLLPSWDVMDLMSWEVASLHDTSLRSSAHDLKNFQHWDLQHMIRKTSSIDCVKQCSGIGTMGALGAGVSLCIPRAKVRTYA